MLLRHIKGRFFIHVSFSFCLILHNLTQWSDFLAKQNYFLFGHKLSPCYLQKLIQVYWKMSVYMTGVVIMEDVDLYNIIAYINLVNLILFYFSAYSIPVMFISRKVTQDKRVVTNFRHLKTRIAKNN